MELHVSVKRVKIFGLNCKGIKGGREVEVDCRFTTQYLTAWLILQSRLDIKISSKNLHASSDYVEMTKSLVKQLKDGEKNLPSQLIFHRRLTLLFLPHVWGVSPLKVVLELIHINQMVPS